MQSIRLRTRQRCVQARLHYLPLGDRLADLVRECTSDEMREIKQKRSMLRDRAVRRPNTQGG